MRQARTITGSGVEIICPQIVILGSVWDRIRAYVHAVDSEIGGMGLVEKRGNLLVVTEVFLPEQEASAATTELDPAASAKLLVELVRSGKSPSQLRFWWHSHNSMPTFWSGTDIATMTGLAQNGYFLALVTNQAEEIRLRLSVGGAVPVALDNLSPVILREIPEDVRDSAQAEVAAKVRQPPLLRRLFPAVSVFGAPATGPTDITLDTEGDESNG